MPERNWRRGRTMPEELYQTGIRLKYGGKSIIYRDACKIASDKRTLQFVTAVICQGNNIVEGRWVKTLLDPETYRGLEGIIHNPVLIDFERLTKQDTLVKVHLEHLEGFEIIPGY